MDSMRSLNTSLPRPSNNQPPEQLLQAFRTAALSVTNLYKTAVTDQGSARQAGYQEALDDLLVFLDKENLGLGDGEGWKVRQWATERLDGTGATHTAGSDEDEDRGEAQNPERGSSPIAQRKATPEAAQTRQPSRSASPARTEPIRTESAPPTSSSAPPSNPEVFNRSSDFTFRAGPTYPEEVEMQSSDSSPSLPEAQPAQSTTASTPAVRLEVHPRPARRHNTRQNPRSTTRELGPGAGSKRRLHFPDDFFDFANLGNGKDTFGGGGKRGRYI